MINSQNSFLGRLTERLPLSVRLSLGAALNDSFLLQLTKRLAGELRRLDPERAARHVNFILRSQQPDGGFAGREGGSDLYYTSFAVRALALLDALDRARCQGVAAYLKSAAAARREYSLIDLVSWLYSVITVQLVGNLPPFAGDTGSFADEVTTSLEAFRRPDGGYARTSEGGVGSAYHTFLAALCYELLGRSLPDEGGVVSFVLSRRRDDGGFVEIAQMKRSGANPTAAAAALLKRFGSVDDQLTRGIENFLDSVKGDEGGFRANTQIPFCDLLSTFTGLLTAHDLGFFKRIDTESCLRFVNQLEGPEGGFRGAIWDDGADTEYTFYGLGALALLGFDRRSD
ncbi:MAG TPA: prenyltransferase/squalene oxidase repeat-containing protein [Blastocatellia bacterium]|jgi:geranylgeranyl transferase type-2 subunit beta|nr:prenyltransferase/squalene oxidase repeat-containing protein [Blastocatellia bacterium]